VRARAEPAAERVVRHASRAAAGQDRDEHGDRVPPELGGEHRREQGDRVAGKRREDVFEVCGREQQQEATGALPALQVRADGV
jgi:hypothetical protein